MKQWITMLLYTGSFLFYPPFLNLYYVSIYGVSFLSQCFILSFHISATLFTNIYTVYQIRIFLIWRFVFKILYTIEMKHLK